MDNPQLGPAGPPGQSAAPGRSGRAKRVVTQAAVKLSSGEKVLVIGLVTDAGKDARLIQVRQAS